MYIYVYICIYLYICIYIYIERKTTLEHGHFIGKTTTVCFTALTDHQVDNKQLIKKQETMCWSVRGLSYWIGGEKSGVNFCKP